MNNKMAKLIVISFIIITALIIVPSVVFAGTFGEISSTINYLAFPRANNTEQITTSIPGSGKISQPERTPIRVEDTANDATPTIMQGWDKTRMKKGDKVYMGRWNGTPFQWSVINPKGANITYVQNTGTKEDLTLTDYNGSPINENNAVFLMASDPLPNIAEQFSDLPPFDINSRYYGSNVWSKMYQFVSHNNNFDNGEFWAMLKTTKTDTPYRISGGDRYANSDGSSMTNILSSNNCFLPSANEIDTYDAGIKNGDYWLRSPLDNDYWPHGASAAVMNYQNQHTYASVRDYRLLRPAMNLNSNRVLLTSAAEGGKPAMLTGGEMVKIGESTTTHYKLTLKVEGPLSNCFDVAPRPSVSAFPGDTINFNYFDAVEGANSYVSAIITGSDDPNKVIYYGKLCLASSKDYSIASVKIPADLKDDVYTLKFFNEQCNADHYSDYSSRIVEVTLYVNHPHVFYDNGGATGGDTPQYLNVYKPGDEVTVRGQGNLVKKVGDIYYTFTGWSDGTETYKSGRINLGGGDKFIINKSDITLKAQWKQCRTVMLGAQLQYGSYVYMGIYDFKAIKWRVLNADGANITYKQDGITQEDLMLRDNDDNEVSAYAAALLAVDDALRVQKQVFGENQKYTYSSIRNWVNEYLLPTSLGLSALDAVWQTTKTDEAYTTGSLTYANQDGTPMNNILNGDKGFLLSAKEANLCLNKAQRTSKYWWWLRSPFSLNFDEAGIVDENGNVSKNQVSNFSSVVYPAINFNRNSIIFTSADISGKPDSVGSEMSTVSASTKSMYRFTLKDSARDSFTISTTAVSGFVGETVSFNYSNALTGREEYISAIIMKNDGSNDILYYGRLICSDDSSYASDVANMTIPEGLSEGTYTVKIFNECQNNLSSVDYSSPLRDVTLTVKNKTETPPEFSSEVYTD